MGEIIEYLEDHSFTSSEDSLLNDIFFMLHFLITIALYISELLNYCYLQT